MLPAPVSRASPVACQDNECNRGTYILWVKNDKETGQVIINLYMRRENNRNDRFIKNKIQKIAISNCCILSTR